MRNAEPTIRALNILLTDDNRFHREQLAHGLAILSHTVHAASSYEETLDALSCFELDCCVIEPVLAGIPWVRGLKAVGDSLARCPWLVLTAFPSKAMRLESLRLGARRVLTKPVSAKQVLQALTSDELSPTPNDSDDLSLARVEWEHLNEVLSLCEGNITEAARRLGIPRQSLYNKLRKLPTPQRHTDAPSKYLTRRS